MRRVIVWISAYCLALLSAVWAARYGYKAADNLGDAVLKGAVLFFIAIFACHAQAWAFALWSRGSRFLGVMLSLVGLVCFAVTLAGGIGTIANSTDKTLAHRTQATEQRDLDRAALNRLGTEAERLPESRAVGALLPIMETLRANPRFKASNGCDPAQITRQDTREHCAEFRKIESELGTSQRRAEIQAELKAIGARFYKPTEVASADPLAKQLAKLLGISVEDAQARYSLGVSLALELAAAFAILVNEVMAHKPDQVSKAASEKARREEPIDAEFTEATETNVVAIPKRPEGIVSAFIAKTLQPEDGSVTPIGEAYEAYQRWCEQEGRVAYDRAKFALHFDVVCKAGGIEIDGEGDEIRAHDYRFVA